MSAERLDRDSVDAQRSDSTSAAIAASAQDTARADSQDFPIVAIGASAGGLDSLEKLFTRLPTNTGMAFVVLQHLSPDFKSLMDELLSRRTSLRIRQAEHEMAVEANTVYLLPPMKEMIIRRRRLLLNDRDPRHGLTLPIDLFLRSWRRTWESARSRSSCRAAAAMDRAACRRSARPEARCSARARTRRSSTACRSAPCRPDTWTRCFRPMTLPMPLRRWSVRRQGLSPKTESDVKGVEAILQLLERGVRDRLLALQGRHGPRRIERRLGFNQAIDIDMYVDQLRNDPRELSSLYEDLLIGVTRFFRDTEAFDTLEHRIIPELVERSQPDEQIRVWVPGCATGQEAYSIAILLHEQLRARRQSGQDQDPRDRRAQGVARRRQRRASTPTNNWRASASLGFSSSSRSSPPATRSHRLLRESIVFAPHNLIRDAPFTKMDLITCRNLLIYFQPHAQKTVLTLFHFALKPGGVLFLGSSESPGGLLDEFDTVDEHAKIYRKRRDIGLPRDLRLPHPAHGHIVPPCEGGGAAHAREPATAGGVRPAARTVHAAKLSRRRTRTAGRYVRGRRRHSCESSHGDPRRICSIWSATRSGR